MKDAPTSNPFLPWGPGPTSQNKKSHPLPPAPPLPHPTTPPIEIFEIFKFNQFTKLLYLAVIGTLTRSSKRGRNTETTGPFSSPGSLLGAWSTQSCPCRRTFSSLAWELLCMGTPRSVIISIWPQSRTGAAVSFHPFTASTNSPLGRAACPL
jgi:hypothetical protein